MPTVDIPDKICPHCGGTRWKIEIEKLKYWTRTRYRCVKKAQERCNRWYSKNPDKVKQYSISTIKRKRESGYYKTDKHRILENNRSRKHSSTLSDKYIRYILRLDHDFRKIEIPQELIELKRTQLLLKRQIKNNGKD